MNSISLHKIHPRRIASIFAFCLSLFVNPANAGETTELRVTANVIANCKMLQVQDINFGSLDPGQAVGTSAEGYISFACTKGVDYRITIDRGEHYDADRGIRRMQGSSSAFLPYSIDNDQVSGSGSGFSVPLGFSIRASVRGEDYRDLPVAAYQDTLRITLEP